jgi:hypothetical protein
LVLTGGASVDIIDKDNMKPVQYGYLLGQTSVVGLLEGRTSGSGVPVKGNVPPTVVHAKSKKDKSASGSGKEKASGTTHGGATPLGDVIHATTKPKRTKEATIETTAAAPSYSNGYHA